MSTTPIALGARRKMFSPTVLLATMLSCVVVLGAMHPDARRTLYMASAQKMDALSVAYLRVLLRSRPDDRTVRYALARDLSASGNHVEARSIVAPLALGTGSAALDARLALLQIDRSDMKQRAPADPQRALLAASIKEQIHAMLAQPVSATTLMELAQASRELGRPDLAAQALEQLARTDAATQQRSLAQAAADWLSHGAPVRAALAYRTLAIQAGKPLAERRANALLALETFMAANEGDAALQFARWIAEHFSEDPVLMQRIVAVAQARNDAVQAQQFGRRLLALSPNSPAALEKQLDLELAAKANPSALSLASRLVALAPSVERRTRLAQIAEWNAAQEKALQQWTLLAQADPTGPAMARALELALARGDDDLWLDLIGRATRTRMLSVAEHDALLQLAQRQPGSRRFIACLESYLAHHEAPLGLWVALSNAQLESGDLPASLSTLHRIPTALAGPVEVARLEALALTRARQPEQGLIRLRAVRALAREADSSYWTLLGDLSWQSENRTDAIHAYRTAWARGVAHVQAAERLIEAADADANHVAAIIVAREAHKRFDDMRWLLIAMDLASRAKRWEELRELLELANSKPGQIARSEMYWIQSANLARHDGRVMEARDAYDRALLANPESVSARVALLWFEIDNGDKPRLSRLLRAWQRDAFGNKAYWRTYGVAMMRLQRAADALPWFERHLHSAPDDVGSSLEYAEALAQAGHKENASHQRRAVYLRLQSQVQASSNTALPEPLLLAYARLVQEFEGETAVQALLTAMIGRGSVPEGARELLVASLLAQQKFNDARYWLQRARAEQHKLPAWQHLAVAMADSNAPEIAQTLALHSAELSVLDRITALRKLGHNRQALEVAEAASLMPEHARNRALAEATAQLRKQQSSRVSFTAENRQLGSMDIRKLGLSGSVPLASGRATVQFAQVTLGSSAAARLPKGGSEQDLSGMVHLPLGTGDAALTLGTNHRPGDSALYARAEWSSPLGRRLVLRVDGAVNTVSEDTVLLRAIGTKDRLGSALTVDLGSSTYARLDAAGQRYTTRRGERLGSGYRVQGELGTIPFRSVPQLQVRLSGSWEQNRLAARLPAELGGVTVPDQATVADAIPAQFGWAGVGSTLSLGDSDRSSGRMHGSVDVLVGQQWPDRTAAYSLRALLGLPVATGGELRAEVFHSNVHGGVSAARSRGLRLSYEHQF